MRILELSITIIRQMKGINKWQMDFLSHLFHLLFSLRGRVNFKNLSRYSHYDESTFHRNFDQAFDFVQFNSKMIMSLDSSQHTWIAAADCSFIKKSGKHTYGLDKFWSSAAGAERTGLEVSAVSLIDTNTRQAYMLDVQQTPAGLSKTDACPHIAQQFGPYSKTARRSRRSRIDFYVEQLEQLQPYLARHGVRYVALDGYYTKFKVFEAFDRWSALEMIGKLRCDADLRYLYDPSESGPALTRRRYDGKVCYDDSTNGWRRWHKEGHLPNGVALYSRILNSVAFKRELKVVACRNESTGEYMLLFSTDLDLSGFQIIQFYACRFQIEFLFRDAKQFTGLEHCQSRKKEKMHFHFNASLSAINLARIDIQSGKTVKSLNDYQRLAYNTKIIDLFIRTSGLDPKRHIYRLAQRKSVFWGLMRA